MENSRCYTASSLVISRNESLFWSTFYQYRETGNVNEWAILSSAPESTISHGVCIKFFYEVSLQSYSLLHFSSSSLLLALDSLLVTVALKSAEQAPNDETTSVCIIMEVFSVQKSCAGSVFFWDGGGMAILVCFLEMIKIRWHPNSKWEVR